MPQAYSNAFAPIYNQKWPQFANYVAPYLAHFYHTCAKDKANRRVLDLCCGTGQVAQYFLQYNYQVTGIDLSYPMLAEAVHNTLPFVQAGQARFIQADAANFALHADFGLVLSTFDALNHLPNAQALRDCFARVAAVTSGYFIFDLNTRVGLNKWDATFVIEESEDLTLLHRGSYDREAGVAWSIVTGFVRQENGLYQRFEERVFNLVLDMRSVRAWLLETGFTKVYFARIENLEEEVAEPELESRVWFVCER